MFFVNQFDFSASSCWRCTELRELIPVWTLLYRRELWGVHVLMRFDTAKKLHEATHLVWVTGVLAMIDYSGLGWITPVQVSLGPQSICLLSSCRITLDLYREVPRQKSASKW